MGSANYLLISVILSLIIIYDLMNSLKKNPKLQDVRYIVHNISSAMNYATIVLLICVMLFNLYVYWMIKDVSMLYVAYWMLLLLVQSISYLTKTGGIYESGIWFSGHFYAWADVKAFYCDKDTGKVGLAVMKESFGYKFKSKLRFQARKSQILEINELFSAKII